MKNIYGYYKVGCEWHDGSETENDVALFEDEVRELGIEDAVLETAKRIHQGCPVSFWFNKQ